MKRVTQTRWKLAIIAICLFLMEAIFKMLMAEFPLTELLTAQSAVIGAYMGAKTVNNIKERPHEQND